MARDITDDIAVLLKGRQVLVIDDQRLSRHIVCRFFAGTACAEMLEAKDGSEGLKMLIDNGPQIGAVICDFNMPGINGLQVLKAIRTGFSDLRPDLPMIMLTGNSDGSLVGAALALDVDAFVVKPVSKNTLLNRLRHVLTVQKTLKPMIDYQSVDLDAALKAMKSAEQGDEKAKPVGREVVLSKVPVPSTLVRDITTPNGDLLLAAGITLTPRLVDRLQELNELGLVPISSVWIAA